MKSPYDELIDAIVDSGVSESEAQLAARRCALAMAQNGAVAYLGGGALAYFLAMNPASAVPYAVGGLTLGAGYALAKSPRCSEVRDAIRFWSSVQF